MNYQRRLIFFIGIVLLGTFLLLSSGCTSIVTPDWANVKMYTSKTFTVKAYNSEGYSIPVDPSKVYRSCTYQCSACGPVWTLNPESGSITTSFTPGAKYYGIYQIKATYKGKTDDSQINVC